MWGHPPNLDDQGLSRARPKRGTGAGEEPIALVDLYTTDADDDWIIEDASDWLQIELISVGQPEAIPGVSLIFTTWRDRTLGRHSQPMTDRLSIRAVPTIACW
jgi:hypothetical protein